MTKQQTVGQAADKFFHAVAIEFAKACKKYPAPNPNTVALTGEMGEVANAMNKEPFENVYAECVQTATMALRLAIEGDPYLDMYRLEHGLDISSSAPEVMEVASAALIETVKGKESG